MIGDVFGKWENWMPFDSARQDAQRGFEVLWPTKMLVYQSETPAWRRSSGKRDSSSMFKKLALFLDETNGSDD